jgi:hypothetical protein
MMLFVTGGVLLQCAGPGENPPPRSPTPIPKATTALRENQPPTRDSFVGPLASSPHLVLGIPTDADSSDDVLLDE